MQTVAIFNNSIKLNLNVENELIYNTYSKIIFTNKIMSLIKLKTLFSSKINLNVAH